LLGSLKDQHAIINMTTVLEEVIAAEAREAEVGSEPAAYAHELPPPPPAPSAHSARKWKNYSDDDEECDNGQPHKQRRTTTPPWWSKSNDEEHDDAGDKPRHSSSSSSDATGMSIDDYEMVEHWQLDSQALKLLKTLALSLPHEKCALVGKLQKKAQFQEGLRNPSAFVITCCKNAMEK
jgi:hypothetical protein